MSSWELMIIKQYRTLNFWVSKRWLLVHFLKVLHISRRHKTHTGPESDQHLKNLSICMWCFFYWFAFIRRKNRLILASSLLLFFSFYLCSSSYLLMTSLCFEIIWRDTFDGFECDHAILFLHKVQYALVYFFFFFISSPAINFTQSQFSFLRCLGISKSLASMGASSPSLFFRS